MEVDLKRAEKIFFAGIGGIGVSGLARILRARGKGTTGSDLNDSKLLKELQTEGIKIKLGHVSENLSADTQLLIYSQAIPENNPERNRAKELGIPQMSYPEALGRVLEDYYVIAVAGTNGKTSTTAMLAWILEQAGLDPTVLLGGLMADSGKNMRVGGSRYFVLEADEYKRGFLNYQPDLAIITNIAADHLDYFEDEADVKQAFAQFLGQIKPNGRLVYNQEDDNTVQLAGQFEGNKTGFKIQQYELKVPGRFYKENASAAAAAARFLRVDERTINEALKHFPGSWRRFEKIGKYKGTDIISDYAHHPAGVTAVLEAAARVYPGKKILAVYQPHQHNRTKMLFNQFVKSFCESPVTDFILTEVFDVAGREEDKDQDVSSKDLVAELQGCGKNAQYAADLDVSEKLIREKSGNYEAALIMGAGDIYLVAERIVKKND